MHDIRPHIPAPFAEPGTVLYIGYRLDACAWLQELAECGNEITVLEIWRPNAEEATHDLRIKGNCWCGDVRQVDQIPGTWDYVWYWHGPEHIENAQFPYVLEKLKSKARRLVAVAAPWGEYPQGPHNGNVHETHRWPVYEEDLEALGMQVVTDGEMDHEGSEIVGWVGV